MAATAAQEESPRVPLKPLEVPEDQAVASSSLFSAAISLSTSAICWSK
jgi:hypothetical protein